MDIMIKLQSMQLERKSEHKKKTGKEMLERKMRLIDKAVKNRRIKRKQGLIG